MDLLGWAPPGAQSLIPDDVAAFLEGLAVLDHHSITSESVFTHFGTVQAQSINLPRITGSSKPVEAPDLTRGVYFRLLFPRVPRSGAQNVEPAPSEFVLDLIFDPISFEFASLTPARFAPASGVTPAHLEPANEVRRPGDTPRKTRLFARGAFRIAANAGGVTDVSFVDFPDPFDPGISAGPVFEAWFEPPHFFAKSIGLSVGDIIVDFSKTVTPPTITARGQPAEWQGIAIEEATVFLPRRVPKLGIVNFGVKDLLIGHPFGLQGEAFVELGQDPSTAIHHAGGPVRLFTDEATPNALAIAADPVDKTGRLFRVTLPSSAPARVRAQLDSPPPETIARWTLPGVGLDSKRDTGFITPVFTAVAGDLLQLELTRVDQVEGETRAVTFGTRSFLFTTDASSGAAPKINIEVAGSTTPFENVLSISGSVEALREVTFVAAPESLELRWEGIFNNLIVTGPRHSLAQLTKPISFGLAFLILRDQQNRTRRIVVHLLEKGELVIGSESGIFNKDRTALPAFKLRAEYDLGAFHQKQTVRRTEGGSTIASDGSVLVPPGVFAEFALKRRPGSSTSGEDEDEEETGGGGPPPGPRTTERVQLLLVFDAVTVVGWGDRKVGGDPPRSEAASGVCSANDTQDIGEKITTPVSEALGAWAAEKLTKDPNAQFLIIGRCDDIGDDKYNRTLANSRANTYADMLRDELKDHPNFQPATTIVRRGEQEPLDPIETPDVRKAMFETDREILAHVTQHQIANADQNLTQLENGTAENRLINDLFNVPNKNAPNKLENPRPCYRRLDIIALIATPTADQGERPSTNSNELGQEPGNGRRRIWVPGADALETTKPVLSEPSYPLLVQAAIAWDSPSVTEAGDWVPTKVEVAVTWVHRGVKVPGTTDPIPAESCREDPTIPEFWKLKARFAHDERTGETVYLLGLDSIGDPTGLACLHNDALASTAALAPAILPLLDTAGLDDGGAKLAALIALMGLGVAASRDGRLVIEGVQAELRSRGYLQAEESRLRLGVDYSVEVGWDFKLIEGKKVKIRYRNVGVLVNTGTLLTEPSALDLDDIRLVFDETSVEVQQPGEWSITNPTLGRLLRVVAARVGTGSAWFEVDMAMALDLGVITITQATIRATLTTDGFSPELRGLEVAIDVPKTLKGRGKLSVTPDGTLVSAIDLQIIPGNISVAASLKLLDDFFSLFVEVRYSTPIPLGSTGLGVFGFNGHLVVNGARAVPAGDVVRRELAWFALSPEQRYQRKDSSWALGLGAVVGTLPDEGFTFNAKGMLAIEIPDLSVIFGVDGEFLKKPGPATAQGEPPPDDPESSLRLLGIVAIDPDAVKLAVDGNYKYRRLLKVDVPLSGYFPFGGTDPYFLRVGSDGFVGDPPGVGARPGTPITVSVLPETLNLEATAYLMIEERGIVSLGSRPGFNFPGFAVGAGLLFKLDWGNSFIGISVHAELLAGIGFSPLTIGAGIFIDGEVSFLFLSAGIKGELVFRYVDHPAGEQLTIFGRLCARVGWWRFKKTKCGTVKVPDELKAIKAPSPIAGVELINRRDRVIGRAGTTLGSGATVWPDALPVIHFAHVADVQLDPGSAFDPGQIDGPKWVGSKEIQFSYRIKRIQLKRVGGAVLTGPLPCSWVFPSHRGLYPPAGEPPSGDERRDLHLLSDHPFRWARNMLDGAASVPADPAGTLDRVCEPVPPATSVCVFGALAQRQGPSVVTLFPHGPSAGPFSSYFELVVSETLGGLNLAQAAIQLSDQGLQLFFGTVRALPPPVPSPIVTEGATAAYESAYIADRGRFVVTIPMEGRFVREVVEPELLLVLCNTPIQQDRGTHCDSFADLTAGVASQTFTRGGLTYRALGGGLAPGLVAATVGGNRALRYLDQGLEVLLPENASEVRITVFVKSATADDVGPQIRLSFRAHSPLGETVASTNDSRNIFNKNRIIKLRSQPGRSIRRVILSGGLGRAHLVSVCFDVDLDDRVQGLLEEAGHAKNGPIVQGRRPDGTVITWTPNVLPPPGPNPTCTYVLYKPPVGGEWVSVRVGPWTHSLVGIVRLCAISAEAQRQRDEAEEEREDFIEEWNTPTTPPRVLLNAGTEYELRVDWEVATWERPLENKQPSKTETAPPGNVAFQPVVIERFFFHTASEVNPLPEDPPANDEQESSFDPRKTKRFVTKMAPDHTSAPHFTDDPVRIVYAVRYVDDLLSKYGRDLVVKVRRTDPAPGSQPASTPPADVGPTHVESGDFPIEFLFLADLHVLQLTEGDSCLNPHPSEGSSDELFFDLDPNANYDLLITAPKPTQPNAPEIVVQRSQFHTSRYASPRELLDAFEFTLGRPSPQLAIEILVDAALPTNEQVGDTAFDVAMVDLGLDPLGIATEPRVALLFQREVNELVLAGVLLEGPEPLHREGRLTIQAARIFSDGGSTVSLSTVRRNDAGTRILLRPAAPATMAGGSSTMELVLNGTREGLVRGSRFITAFGPDLAAEGSL